MKYFGTDGFRGKVSEKLNVTHAFKIGMYLGYYFSKKRPNPRMIVGKDTRLSGDTLEHALAAGAASMGADVYLLGVTPTPAISLLIRKGNYDMGAMISASHNPYQDNGIKLFNEDGFKLQEEVELLIEEYIDSEELLPLVSGKEIGKIIDIHDNGLAKYAAWLHEVCDFDFTGMRVLCDLANGSATAIAKSVLESYNAEVDVISNEPNGININEGCGSTHLELLQDKMIEGEYDIGLAFDGDADRLLAVDEHGCIVDGDIIMYLCGKYMKEHGTLNQDVVVTTVMSNIGLHKAFKECGIATKKTAVGDKYVSECLFAEGYSLGGEQSGHIIFKDEAVTGDGLLTALHLLQVLKHSGTSLSTLRESIEIYPQLLKNVRVQSKKAAMEDSDVKAAIEQITVLLGDNGRILVRPSGTEELIRVMVEAQSDELCENYVNQVIEIIENKRL
ncbi:MAG: phosphoglucosamine mutase [Erysipelotrichaceae bacterium]|nr:phosphoglucosamine mutase [Erysipelotrichaceae bacterium]MBQ9987654.1 phosphoglucosamine mutase [Erysipelotrichales bacterium]MBR3693264.1 phosphoglucosamine mutase [Erysipelotrichales bacterium]